MGKKVSVMRNRSLRTGTVIGAYRLLHLIGFGPASFVYLAEQGKISQQVILKLIDVEAARSTYQHHFLAEATHISRLDHPSLLPFLSAGFYDDTPYLIRPYVKHGSLLAHVSEATPQLFSVERSLRILQQIGEALFFAHQRRVVHANLKPENILLLERERVVLTDFCLHSLTKVIRPARLRTAEAACYMAPEQFQGITTPLSDQYAFACLAYELLTGRPPFVAADFKTLAYKHTVEPPLPPELQNPRLPRALNSALLKALEKWPDDRYADMQDFLSALLSHSSGTSFPGARARLSLESGKYVIPPALVLPHVHRTHEPETPLPVTDKSSVMPSSWNKKASPIRLLRQFILKLFSLLLKSGETALLATLIFLFDRLKNCRELFSLLKLCFTVLQERWKLAWPASKTRAHNVWKELTAMLAGAWSALRPLQFMPRLRRRRRLRPARPAPLSTLPPHFPQSISPAANPGFATRYFWTRRRLLFASGAGLLGASAGMSYLAHRLLANSPPPPAALTQTLMPAAMQASATANAFLPTRATSLLTFTQHRQTVRSVAWSPDGTLLASGADDRSLLTWDLTARLHLRTEQHAAVNAIAWAPDSRQLALAVANQVIFLDTKAGIQEAGDAYTHRATITCLAWSQQQPRLLVSGGLDKLAVIWDTWTFQPQLRFRQHSTAIHSAAWSEDGQTVGTCSEGGVTRVWHANNGAQLHGLFFDRAVACTSLAFEPDSARLAVGQIDGVLRLWPEGLTCHSEGKGNRQGQCLDAPARLHVHTGAIRAVAWSPTGKLLASAGDDGALFIWEPAQRQTPLLKIVHTAPILALSWSPDGKRLAAASGNTITLWALS